MFEKAKEKIKQKLGEYERWNDVFRTFRGKMVSTLLPHMEWISETIFINFTYLGLTATAEDRHLR